VSCRFVTGLCKHPYACCASRNVFFERWSSYAASSVRELRSIRKLRIHEPRCVDTKFWGNPPGAWDFHPLRLRIYTFKSKPENYEPWALSTRIGRRHWVRQQCLAKAAHTMWHYVSNAARLGLICFPCVRLSQVST